MTAFLKAQAAQLRKFARDLEAQAAAIDAEIERLEPKSVTKPATAVLTEDDTISVATGSTTDSKKPRWHPSYATSLHKIIPKSAQSEAILSSFKALHTEPLSKFEDDGKNAFMEYLVSHGHASRDAVEAVVFAKKA